MICLKFDEKKCYGLGGEMKMNIITQSEWNDISDVMFYVRKSYNTKYLNDEDKIKIIELYLNTALGLCKKIRERWGQ